MIHHAAKDPLADEGRDTAMLSAKRCQDSGTVPVSSGVTGGENVRHVARFVVLYHISVIYNTIYIYNYIYIYTYKYDIYIYVYI